MRYVVLEKKRGETPLMALTAWKQANPAYEHIPAAYAGRLDPMAQGKLLVLLGEECKKQGKYTQLDKEYEVDVLLDIGSDTGDALGVVSLSRHETRVDPKALAILLKKEQGRHMRTYPAYSSKTVEGKPLFLHALERTLGSITIPEHEERMYRIQNLDAKKISAQELQEYIQEFLALVPSTDEPSKRLGADFRITDVRASWDAAFTRAGAREFLVLSLSVSCASGTYMRSLAGRIGEALGTKSLALSITRTKIGKYWKGVWVRKL